MLMLYLTLAMIGGYLQNAALPAGPNAGKWHPPLSHWYPQEEDSNFNYKKQRTSHSHPNIIGPSCYSLSLSYTHTHSYIDTNTHTHTHTQTFTLTCPTFVFAPKFISPWTHSPPNYKCRILFDSQFCYYPYLIKHRINPVSLETTLKFSPLLLFHLYYSSGITCYLSPGLKLSAVLGSR
jgi:hypothetical protein